MDIMNSNAANAAPAAGPAAGAPAASVPAASVPAAGSAPSGGFPDGVGGLSVGTPVLDVKVHSVVPSSTAGMDADEIMNILHNLDVEGVREAASAHTALGETLERIAENLVVNGQTLAASWQGDSAQAAVAKFQQMHAQTSQLAAQAKQTGQVLEWTAGILDQYRRLPHPLGGAAAGPGSPADTPGAAIGDIIAAVAGAAPGAAHQAKANAQARQYLSELNQHLVTANSSLPSTIGHSPAASSGGSAHGGAAAGLRAGAGRVAGGHTPSGPYAGAGAAPGGLSGTPSRTASFTPAQPVPSTARLQAAGAPAPVAPVAPPAPAPAAPAVSPLPGIVPVGPVSGASAPSGGSLGSTTEEDPSEEESALAASEGSESERNQATIGDRKENPAGGEGSALPMMGGPAGQPGQERLRESWMNEDRNIWGVPEDTVGPEIGSH